MTNKKIWLGCLSLFIGLSIFSYFFYGRWRTSQVITLPSPNCDLRLGPCASTLPTGERIELRMKPTYMPVLTSVHLEVKTDHIPVRKMFVYFKGADMNMGEFRFTLLPQKEGIYSAQTILPTCMQEQMIWHAVVDIESSHKRYNAAFMLVNQRPAT
jgi:hypothetical protein